MSDRADELIRHCISHCPHEWQVAGGVEHECIWDEIVGVIRQAGLLREALEKIGKSVSAGRSDRSVGMIVRAALEPKP